MFLAFPLESSMLLVAIRANSALYIFLKICLDKSALSKKGQGRAVVGPNISVWQNVICRFSVLWPGGGSVCPRLRPKGCRGCTNVRSTNLRPPCPIKRHGGFYLEYQHHNNLDILLGVKQFLNEPLWHHFHITFSKF